MPYNNMLSISERNEVLRILSDEASEEQVRFLLSLILLRFIYNQEDETYKHGVLSELKKFCGQFKVEKNKDICGG